MLNGQDASITAKTRLKVTYEQKVKPSCNISGPLGG
jgi:hypothetical protein